MSAGWVVGVSIPPLVALRLGIRRFAGRPSLGRLQGRVGLVSLRVGRGSKTSAAAAARSAIPGGGRNSTADRARQRKAVRGEHCPTCGAQDPAWSEQESRVHQVRSTRQEILEDANPVSVSRGRDSMGLLESAPVLEVSRGLTALRPHL